MNLALKKEQPAQRCEICHQADMFDPTTNSCMRCSMIKPFSPSVPTKSASNISSTALPSLPFFQRYGQTNSLVEKFQAIFNFSWIIIIIGMLLLSIISFMGMPLLGTIIFVILLTLVAGLAYQLKSQTGDTRAAQKAQIELRIEWLTKNVAPLAYTLFIKTEAVGKEWHYYACLYLRDQDTESNPVYRLPVVRPNWDMDSIFNAYLPANVYFDPAGWMAVIYTPQGRLVSLNYLPAASQTYLLED